jgi:hypothetical protein
MERRLMMDLKIATPCPWLILNRPSVSFFYKLIKYFSVFSTKNYFCRPLKLTNAYQTVLLTIHKNVARQLLVEKSAGYASAKDLAGMKAKAANPETYMILGEMLSYDPYAFILPENDSNFRDFINEQLIRMFVDGRYMTYYEKWFGPEGVVPFTMTDDFKTL